MLEDEKDETKKWWNNESGSQWYKNKSFEQTTFIFRPNLSTKDGLFAQTRTNEHFHRVQHIRISLGWNFDIKQNVSSLMLAVW